jgi:hypothetical protein
MVKEARLLTPDEWSLVRPEVEGRFGNSMPTDPTQSSFLATLDGDRLAGFVHIERLVHVNCVFVDEAYRPTRVGWNLMREADAIMQGLPGNSALVLTGKESVGRMCERLGMRLLAAQMIYRKDF